MTPKLQKVCNFYLNGMSMREALLKAGYSDSYAEHNSTKFLHNREVIKYIKTRQKAEADASLVDAIYLLDQLKKIIDSPNSTNKEKSEALKILNDRLMRSAEIENKLKDIDSQKTNLTIDFNIVTKDENKN
jgi:phage terminase small subunit